MIEEVPELLLKQECDLKIAPLVVPVNTKITHLVFGFFFSHFLHVSICNKFINRKKRDTDVSEQAVSCQIQFKNFASAIMLLCS